MWVLDVILSHVLLAMDGAEMEHRAAAGAAPPRHAEELIAGTSAHGSRQRARAQEQSQAGRRA
jgi:hypothetical protein